MNRRIEWTEEMLSYLREHYPTESASDIADVVGCSTDTVIKKAHALGIQKDPSFTTAAFIGRYSRKRKEKKGE